MNYKSFYELLNQLESDDKLRDSEQGQLTIDRDRNCQLNGSHEEITSVHEDSLKKKSTIISPIAPERQNFAPPSSKCSIMVV